MELPESSSRDGSPAAATPTTTDSDTAPTATAIAPDSHASTAAAASDSDTADAVEHQISLHTEDMPSQNPSGSNEISSNPSASPADSEVPESTSLVTPAYPSHEQRADIAWRLLPPAEVHKPSGSGLQQEKKRKNPFDSGNNTISKRCRCDKTRCLDLRCQCFFGEWYCEEDCSCKGCFNQEEFDEAISEAKQKVNSEDPLAFETNRAKLHNGGSRR